MKNKSNNQIAVIMAGGSGERFWPVSRRANPKQFLHLTKGNLSLFEQAIANIKTIFLSEHIFIVAGTHHVDAIKNANTGIPEDNIIVEPFKRNTSGCLALAAAELLSVHSGGGSDITVGVFPADHFIMNPDRYRTFIGAAMTVAENEKALVTFGIQPDRPETGYGYIETTGNTETHVGNIPVYLAARFHEKPDFETAKKYVSSGRFFWNSGMFFWRLSTFLDELSYASPDIFKAVKDMSKAHASGNQKLFTTIFEGLQDISIDYALMEKARRVMVLKADFGWDDVGAWDALDRTCEKDENGNVTAGDPVLIDTHNCIVYSDSGSGNTAVGVVGIDGLAVIVSDEGVLVVPKDRAQDVRKVVSELKKKDSEQL